MANLSKVGGVGHHLIDVLVRSRDFIDEGVAWMGWRT
jgi:hypothetical protein